MDQEIRHFLISGIVQGVGYRYFARDRARRLGLKGWVRNLSDGRVELIAQGAPQAIATLEIELRQGPARARVEALTAKKLLSFEEPLLGFTIIQNGD